MLKKNILLKKQVSILILFLLLSFFIYDINIYKVFLILAFIDIFIISFKNGYFNLFQIFLVTFFLFNLSRIFLDVFFNFNMSLCTLYLGGNLKDTTVIILLKYFIVFLIISSICFLLNRNNNSKNNKSLKPKDQNHYFLKILFIIFLFFSFLKMANLILYVFFHGYISLFESGIEKTRFLRGVSVICEAIFIVLIYNAKDKKEFLIYSYGILIFLFIPKLLTGIRGPSMTFILFIIYLYNARYKIKKKLKIIILGFLFIPLIQIILLFRYNIDINTNNVLTLNTLLQVLNTQGVSMLIPAYLIEFKEELIYNHKYPYFLYYFIILFQGFDKGQNLTQIIKGNYLGHKLTYFLSPELFLKGAGTGTAIIAELIDLSHLKILLFIIFSFLYFKFSLYLEKIKEKNIFFFTFAYFYLQSFIYSPRDSVGKVIPKIIIFLPIVIFFYFINKFLLKLKNKY